MTLDQSFQISTGSIWSIPVYDGSNLVISTEVIGTTGGVYLSKYDASLNLVGIATHIISPSLLNSNPTLTYTYANNITAIADHKHIFQDGYHYITCSTSGTGTGGNLYLMKIDTDFVLQDIVEVTTDNAPTNDMFLVGDGSKIYVGKFHPGQGHDIYSYDAGLVSLGAATPIGNTGSGAKATMVVTENMLIYSGRTGDGTPHLFAVDKLTGEELARVEAPGISRYGMMTYVLDGHQYVMLQTGPTLTTMALPGTYAPGGGDH